MVTYSQNDRQMRISGWGADGQEKISQSRALVIGSDVLSQMLLVNLAGLGVGNIMVLDNKRVGRKDGFNFLYQKEDSENLYISKKRGELIKKRLESINEDINVINRHSKFRQAWLQDFNPSIIYDVSNNIVSKRESLTYAIEKEVPYINICSDNHKGLLTAYNPKDEKKITESMHNKILAEEFSGKEQGPVASGILAGLGAEELRKHAVMLANGGMDSPMGTGDTITYNMFSKNRTSLEDDEKVHPLNYYKDLNVLMVGAGAIGNYVGLNLTLLGFGNVDVVDDDDVEDHNLNRQFLFYEKIGEGKAKTLSERIKEFNPSIKSDYIDKRLDENDAKIFSEGNASGKYDLVFGCVDNLETRKLINTFCVEYGIPYVDGGTKALTGQVMSYTPGKKKCIDCQMDLDKMIEQRDETRKRIYGENSCIQADPSVVIPNIIIGSSMVGEAIRIIYDSPKAEPFMGRFKYRSFSNNRIWSSNFIGYKKDCGCKNGL